ncbi:MAG: 50S ribosomal protein L21 [Patescibacteria group bacterium]|jgi:large subunit ribosomal protein L21
MKLAVIKTGGKQYKVAEGDKLKIEKLVLETGANVNFEEVLLVADGEKVSVGTPNLGVKVSGKVLAQGKGAKIMVEKYKPKVRYHKVYGHRQPFTEVLIEKIG